MNWNHAIKLLSRCRQLESITYRYRHSTVISGQPFPKALKNVFENKWHKIQLHINSYRFRESDYKSIPISNVVSFRKLRTINTQRGPSFTEFVAAARRLEALHLTEHAGLQALDNDIRLPPIKKLTLSDYDWNMGAAEVDEIWDFSNLETLKFRGGRLAGYNLLHAIQPALPLRLKKFTFITFDQMHYALAKMLPGFVEQLTQLETLHLDSFGSVSLLVPAIVKMGSNLRVLKLADCNRIVHVNNKDLMDIVTSCPKLARLDLDLKIDPKDHLELYHTLAQFKRLQIVRISLWLNDLTTDGVRIRTEEYVDFMMAKCPDVRLEVERLYIVDYLDHQKATERDWKLQIAMNWDSSGAQPLSNNFWEMNRKPHNKESLGLGGSHYC